MSWLTTACVQQLSRKPEKTGNKYNPLPSPPARPADCGKQRSRPPRCRRGDDLGRKATVTAGSRSDPGYCRTRYTVPARLRLRSEGPLTFTTANISEKSLSGFSKFGDMPSRVEKNRARHGVTHIYPGQFIGIICAQSQIMRAT